MKVEKLEKHTRQFNQKIELGLSFSQMCFVYNVVIGVILLHKVLKMDPHKDKDNIAQNLGTGVRIVLVLYRILILKYNLSNFKATIV